MAGSNDTGILFTFLVLNLTLSVLWSVLLPAIYLPIDTAGAMNVTSPEYNASTENIQGTSMWSLGGFLMALFLLPALPANMGIIGVFITGFFILIKVVIIWLVVRLFRSGGG
jgi:hypothetical protein